MATPKRVTVDPGRPGSTLTRLRQAVLEWMDAPLGSLGWSGGSPLERWHAREDFFPGGRIREDARTCQSSEWEWPEQGAAGRARRQREAAEEETKQANPSLGGAPHNTGCSGRAPVGRVPRPDLIVSPGADGVSGWPGGGRRLFGEPTAYFLNKSGLWGPTPEPWRERDVRLLTEMEAKARNDRSLEGRNLTTALRDIQTAQKAPRLVEQIRLNLSATALLDEARYPDLTRCSADDLDTNLRHLGCKNGVVDLRTGELLSAAEGRKQLVTRSTGIDFRPEAEHPDVERLFQHLNHEESEWYWGVMGHALHGRPSRRIYLIVGPTGGGKIVMATALVHTLGQYCEEPMDSALVESGGSGQHNTEVSAFAHPVRVCVVDEVTTPKGLVSSAVMKRLSGDGHITFRKLHENPQTREATATLFMICNPGSIPRLHLEDEAMRDRLRELIYPPVPEELKDPGMPDRVKTKEFGEAFFARMIKEAATIEPGRPPKSISHGGRCHEATRRRGSGRIRHFRQATPSRRWQEPVRRRYMGGFVRIPRRQQRRQEGRGHLSRCFHAMAARLGARSSAREDRESEGQGPTWLAGLGSGGQRRSSRLLRCSLRKLKGGGE